MIKTNFYPLLPQPYTLKSSIKISLVLLGTVSLSACDDNTTTRYEYNNREECVQDWGETECEDSNSSGRSSGGTYYYYRPSHYKTDNHQAKNARNITRGGFGSSGRSSS